MEKKTKKYNFSFIFMLLILGLIFVYLASAPNGDKGEEITVYEATTLIKDEKITDIWYRGAEFRFKLKNNSSVEKAEDFPLNADYTLVVGSQSEFDLIIAAAQEVVFADGSVIKLTHEEVVDYWSYIMPILYIGGGILLIVFMFKMLNRSNNSAMSFGKSKAQQTKNVKVRFNDIAGADEEKEELAEIVEFLKNPQKFTKLGARIPKGVLLVGNPGTGKTLLARAVAGESNVQFLSISGSDFVEMFVGVGASRVRDLFEQAKRSAPCIVFIDEIDAVGRQRGAGLGGGNDEREQTLNQLLVEMDGFEANEGIIVLAATNRSDVLDPALMRPGRFDRQIYVHIPDVRGREGILKIHARNKPLDDEIDFKTLARITSGFTGADIENMLNEAAILAARNNRTKIIMTDITEGINKVIMGPQKKSLVVTEKDKRITAYHESGHAILSKKLENCEDVQEVSIIPRGMAAGYTMSRPSSDDSHMTLGKLNDEIAVIMGGRIAEEVFMTDITTGASNDIQKASKIAKKMVTEWGMTEKFGFMNFAQGEEVFIGRDYQTKKDYSEKTAAEIDEEIQKILNYNYKRAKKIIQDNREAIVVMADVLLEKETIYKEEVDLIVQGKTASEVIEFMNDKKHQQDIKEEKRRREQEIETKLEELELKVRTAQMYYRSGKISKQDCDILIEAKNKMAQELEQMRTNLESEQKAEIKPAEEEKPKKTIRKTTPSKDKAPSKTVNKTTKTTKTTKGAKGDKNEEEN